MSGGLGSTRAGQPGRVWTRSDAGVQLLGMALEEATGDGWPELYRRYLFEPLGLGDTSYPGPRDLDLPGAAPERLGRRPRRRRHAGLRRVRST